jgi:hypothetical protein
MADFDMDFDLSVFDLASVEGGSSPAATSIFSRNSPVQSLVSGDDEIFDESAASPPLDLQSYSTPGGYERMYAGLNGRSSSVAGASVSKREEDAGHGFLQTPVDAEPAFEIAEDGSIVERDSAQRHADSLHGGLFDAALRTGGGVGEGLGGANVQVSNVLCWDVMDATETRRTERRRWNSDFRG